MAKVCVYCIYVQSQLKCVFLRMQVRFQQDLAMASDRKDMSIQFLLMELETVGNIRFEEGNTSHAW